MHFAAANTVASALAGSWRAALSIGMIGPQVRAVACMLPGRWWIRAPCRKLRPDYRSRLIVFTVLAFLSRVRAAFH